MSDKKQQIYHISEQVEVVEITKEQYCKLRGWDVPADEDPTEVGYLIKKASGQVTWMDSAELSRVARPCTTAIDRLKIELEDLVQRTKGLSGFLSSDREKPLDPPHETLLPVQLELMNALILILKSRSSGYGEVLLENLSWPIAQMLLSQGLTAKRAGWNGKNQFISYNPGIVRLEADKFWIPANKKAAIRNGGTLDVTPYYTIKTMQNTVQMGWVPSAGDLSARDWVVYS